MTAHDDWTRDKYGNPVGRGNLLVDAAEVDPAMWRRKPQRPPPTYEDVRLVAEVLSRINADLIERHFGLSADTAQQFMDRLVAEKRFGDLQPDGWHYPPIRKLRLRRSRRKTKATN